MLESGPRSLWVHDLPLCFPSRACVDVPPGGAQAMYLVADVASASPAFAAALWAGLGVSLVLVGIGLRRQRRGFGLRRWLVVLAVALVVGGGALAWTMNGWLGEAALVYGGIDGRPSTPVPSSIVSSWPLVQAGARAAMALGAIALFLMLDTTVLLRRRAREAPGAGLEQPAEEGGADATANRTGAKQEVASPRALTRVQELEIQRSRGRTRRRQAGTGPPRARFLSGM